MPLPHLELDALTSDLDGLTTSGTSPELEDARAAIRTAADALSRGELSESAKSDADRALTLARMALERARHAMGAAGVPRPSWQEALRATPAAAPPAAGRRPADKSARHAHLELDSEIPDAHPAKTAIEASVAGAFAGVKGRWRVAILVQPNAQWWGLRVEGASICWTGTLEGPEEQSPEFLSGRVREAVQLGLMQAALPRRRSRS